MDGIGMIRRGRQRVIPYPYRGGFYIRLEEDVSVPLDERDPDRYELVLETECDIQEVSKAANPTLIATFSIFFPWDRTRLCPVSRGMRFSGDARGIDVSGMVTNVVASELDGVVAYCKDYDTEDEGDF